MALVWPFEWFARRAFRKGLTDTGYFRDRVRKAAYLLARGDSERVHEMALERLNKYEEVLREESAHFYFSELTANLKGREVGVFGTAAGLDKNCDAVGPLSHIFGFQEVGTIVMSPRDGNRRPRVVADEAEGDVYNAQGFPSKGLEYAEGKLRAYRESGGEAFILASVCGLPPTPDRLNVAVAEMETLLFHLGPFVDGFVWNPFSPNTDALKALRTPETFEEYAKRVRAAAGEKPALVKMGPYDDSGRQQWIDLAGEWIGGGGDGIVAVNTYMVSRDKVPSKDWGYQSAGRSGTFLQPYRQQAIIDARKAFPSAVIIATGGIDTGGEAWAALEAGANLLEGYTPYTLNGFGIIPEMARGVIHRLRERGFSRLSDYQAARRAS